MRRRSSPGSRRSKVRRIRSAPCARNSTGGARRSRPASTAFPAFSAATPKGAFYAFPNISRTGWKAKPLASALLQDAGVATIGGPDFGVHGEGYLRLSYANSLENIERALERMGDFLSRPARAAASL